MAEKTCRRNRGVIWIDEATNALIAIWSEENIRISLEDSKSSKETREIYRSIMVQMQNQGFCDYTLTHVINKMKKLRQRYKQEVDKKKRSGRGRGKAWKFFNSLNEILGHRPSVQPTFLIDTSKDKVDANENEASEDVVHSLKTKYGDGEMLTEVCQKCGYIDDNLYSAGVHESHSGSIKVYTEDDKFSCPRCTSGDMSNTELNDAEDQVSDQTSDQVSEGPVDNDNGSIVETSEAESKPLKIKPKKKTSFEKGIEVICEKFDSSCENEMNWLMKMEENRQKHEVDLQIKQAQLENERRTQEREHELKLFSLLMGRAQHPRDYSGYLAEMAPPHPMPSCYSMPSYNWDQAATSHSTISADENLHYTTL